MLSLITYHLSLFTRLVFFENLRSRAEKLIKADGGADDDAADEPERRRAGQQIEKPAENHHKQNRAEQTDCRAPSHSALPERFGGRQRFGFRRVFSLRNAFIYRRIFSFEDITVLGCRRKSRR